MNKREKNMLELFPVALIDREVNPAGAQPSGRRSAARWTALLLVALTIALPALSLVYDWEGFIDPLQLTFGLTLLTLFFCHRAFFARR